MITIMERKALDNRIEDPATLDMLKRSYDTKKTRMLTLIYPDGREKVVDGADIDVQKLMRYCEADGIVVKREG